MPIAFSDLVRRLQLFVVLILDSERPADVVDPILIGRWIVTAWRFVADCIRVFPVGVDITAGHFGAGLVVFAYRVAQLLTSRACG